MAFLGFSSVNRAWEVYMLLLFWRDCLQMLVFKDSVELSSNAVIFVCKKRSQSVSFQDKVSADVVYVGVVSFKFISF